MDKTTGAKRAEIDISGMHCVSCSRNIEKFLKMTKGVTGANVNFASGKAVVEYDPGQVTPEEIEKVITETGYEVVKPGQAAITGKRTIRFHITGMDNSHCIGVIDKALGSLKGISGKKLGANEKAEIEFDESVVTVEDIIETIKGAGYEAVAEPEDAESPGETLRKKEIEYLKTRLIISAVLSLPLFYFSMGLHMGFPMFGLSEKLIALIQFLFATPIVAAGSRFYKRGTLSVLKTGSSTMDTLVALGTGSAYIYSLFAFIMILSGVPGFGTHSLYFEISGFLITFILLGNLMSALARGRTAEAVKKLAGLGVKTALVVKNGSETEVSVSDIVPGDLVIVKPGQRVPVDGVVVDGASYVDESLVTGESVPVEKKAQDPVIGGTINTNGTFRFRVTKVGKDTMLSQIIKLVEDAAASKAPVEDLADRISAVFVPVVLVIAVCVLAAWLAAGQPFGFALKNFIGVLIIACPCAMGLATPTAIMVGTGTAAQKGILIKDAGTVEAAGRITAVVFDKTGTLTVGKPAVTGFEVLASFDKGAVLSLAGSLESRSEHPLAAAIVKYCREQGAVISDAPGFTAVQGKGVSAEIDCKKSAAGKEEFLKELGYTIAPELSAKAAGSGTVVWVGTGGKAAAIFSVSDELKKNSGAAVEKLKKSGIKVYMITGDNENAAKKAASELGIEKFLYGLLPAGKSEEIRKLKSLGEVVAMVGDGINDAPALMSADVGIALGSGTDVALESAGIVLVKNDPLDAVKALELGRFMMRKIKQNLFWAFAYNVIGIPVAAGALYPFTGFLLNPALAGLAMAFSSVSVVANSLSIKRFK